MPRNCHSILAADLQGVFDPSRFSIPRAPVALGRLPSYDGPRLPSCLDMLVKFPLGHLQLPDCYRGIEAIKHFVATAIRRNAMFKPRWNEDCYLYLTVDHRTVAPGKTHRNSGWHFDGMQGSRYPDKIPVCHQYVSSTALGTEYYIGSDLDMTGLDEDSCNWFDEIERQLPKNAATMTFDAGDIILMSAYQVHRAVPADRETDRLFLRLDVSHKKQDRLGNTINPNLVAPWPMVERRFALHKPVSDTGWNAPTS